mmetsp:Transcript_18255/g.33761  ORF Transcript_18255/g.33761 Transcript_18255/m.33761 type:complete len:413 (+) Transcript_18255:225-1463(+)
MTMVRWALAAVAIAATVSVARGQTQAELVEAVLADDVDAVRALVQADVDAGIANVSEVCTGEVICPPLPLVCVVNSVEVLKELQAAATFEANGPPSGLGPLTVWSSTLRLDLIEQLYAESEVDSNKIFEGEPPLLSVLKPIPEAGDISLVTDIVAVLLREGADVNFQTTSGQTPFHKVIDSEVDLPAEEIMQLMLEVDGIDLTLKQTDGVSLTHLASDSSMKGARESILQDILAITKADVNAPAGNFLNAPLHTALLARTDQASILPFVRTLTPFADVNLKNNLGETPLLLAAKKAYDVIGDHLLGVGAEDDFDNDGRTALHQLASFVSDDAEKCEAAGAFARTLIAKNFDQTKENALGQTALELAEEVVGGCDEVLSALRGEVATERPSSAAPSVGVWVKLITICLVALAV